MIQFHIGSHAAVLTLQEVFGAPDPDSAVISAGHQVLAVATEVEAGYTPTVTLWKTSMISTSFLCDEWNR